jgi:filamentous hemagglutinin
MARLARVSLALTGLSAALVQAQIVADPSAPGNQRPTVLAAPNGVPLVNIQTPSAAGVSRNTYQQFDVGTPGAVLNNSRTNAPTQLGGWVQGNPWLAAGEARVILNEVNSHHPSHLNGFVEVAGQRAEVIIANPAGIQVNGGGFINASRATLTTGTPVMNGGHLESFRVQRGTVRIDGAGLNTAHSDYTAILARAIEINAHLHAQQLHLVAGANTVDAQHHHVQTGVAPDPQGPMPSFALDVSELGGMYAGHIRLIGTEAGVGVRHHGTLAASAGDVHISTQGWLSSAGRIEAAQHLTVQAQEVTHRGLTDSAHTHIQATSLDNVGTGRIFGDRVTIAAHTLTNREDTGDDVTAPDARAAAVIAARDRLDIGVQHLTNQEGALLFSAGDLAIGGALDAYRHAITDGSAHAQTLNNHSATIESLGHMALAADVLRNTNAHFHTELALISGPESLTLIQPQGSSSRIPTSLLRVHHFSNAWGYVFNTDPDPVQASVALLGQTPIPGVGEETCTDWNDASTCSRLPGADYLPDDPAWAYFGLTPPLPEPVAPVLPPPQVPVLDPLADPEAYDAAWAYYQAEQAAYSAAWDAYHAVHAQWDALTEDLYETLDQRITDYNRQFASILITHWTQYNITSTEHESQVTQSAPGQILAGGHLSLRGQDLLNDKSRIIAGLSLQGDLNNLENRQALGHNVVNETGTTQSSWTYTRRGGFFRTGSKRTHRDFSGHSPYNPPDVVTSINLNVAEIQQHAAIPTAPSIVLPVSSLFSIQPDSAARFVVETDPRFTHYRQWLSSDYLLQALSLDPTTTQKRLGDGFYEQRLIREQVAALTGLRFLGDHRDDEAQYQALMTAAATFAQAQPLRPGIALSAAQVAQLTSDIVWLVAETVTLPDGTTTTALVPRVYLAPRTGDLAQNGQLFGTLFGGAQNGAQNTGSLISARDIQLSLSGDLNNSGTIAGRRLVDLSAQNITHSGLLQGDAVMLSARDDIRIDGGQVAAHSGMVLQAEGDITVQSTTQRSSNQAGGNTFSQQGIDRIAGLYVSGEAGVLLASAGNDIHLIAAQVRNAGTGATQLQAGGDLHLATVQTGQSHDITWNANHYHRQSSSTDVGTHITGGGAVSILAHNDITARAAHVNAQGALNLQATDGNITIEAGQSSQSLAEAHQSRSRSTLGSRTTTTRSSSQSSTAQASELGGQTVNIQSGADTRIVGSNLLADQDLNIQAGGNLSIEPAQNTQSSSSFNQTRRSGVFGSGGIGFTIGSQQQSTDVQNQRISAAVSTVGAIDGNVNLNAGQTYTQTGSDVLAPGGDVHISAQAVTINEARESSQQSIEQRARQSGLTVAITSPIISAAQTIHQQIEAAGHTQSGRMRALAAANVALAGFEAYQQVQAGRGQNIHGKDGQILTGKTEADGTPITRDASMADKVGGINLSVSLGSSRSQSNQSSSADTARGSSVIAGGDVTITARGAGANSDLILQGSTVQAGGTTRLQAEDDIRLLAAANTSAEASFNRSSSASVGLSMGLGGQNAGMSLNASASRAQGQGSGDGTTYTHSQVSGQTVEIESGSNATLQGAVVQGEQVTATVGGDLYIQTLQDSNRYNERQRNAGFNVSVPIGPGAVSGSLNAGRTDIRSNYQSATEQSGILAGDGGFQVMVQGDTTLVGAAIMSSQAAQDAKANQIQTATLNSRDLQNSASASVSSSGISVGTDMFNQGRYGLAKTGIANLANQATAQTEQQGQTLSAISSADIVITALARHQALTNETPEQTAERLQTNAQGSTHTGVDVADVKAMRSQVEADRAIKNEAVRQLTNLTDQAWKVMFAEQPKFYAVSCPVGANCIAQPELVQVRQVRGTAEEVQQQIASAEAGAVLAVNGIENPLGRAAQLAFQNAETFELANSETGLLVPTKPSIIYLMHYVPATNALAETMIAFYEKNLASTLGHSNPTHAYAQALAERGTQETTSLGHSRGTIVQTNANQILAQQGHTNPNLSVQGVGGAVDQRTYFEAAAAVQGNAANVDQRNQIHYSYFSNDPVSTSRLSGGNPGAWRLSDFWQVLTTSNSMHSCYGTGAQDCSQVQNPVPSGPQGTPEGNAKLIEYRGGELYNRANSQGVQP